MNERERERISDQSTMGGGPDRNFVVISEHEAPDGQRYYRRSGEMARDYANDRLRWIIEESGALSATLCQVISERKRLFQSVEVDRANCDAAKGVLSLGARAKEGFGSI